MGRGELLRLVVGLAIIAGMMFLAWEIAIGHVEEKTSFGLSPILTVLSTVVLKWAEWAFRTYLHPTDQSQMDPPDKTLDSRGTE